MNIHIKEKNLKNNKINHLKKIMFEKSSFLKSWDRRKFFHLILNFPLATVIFANFMAYQLVLYSLYTYDTFDYIQSNFYDKKEFTKFKFHPYGEIYDICIQNDNKEKILFDYFGLNVPKKLWYKGLSDLVALGDHKFITVKDEFNELSRRIEDLNINELIYIGEKNESYNNSSNVENRESKLSEFKKSFNNNIKEKVSSYIRNLQNLRIDYMKFYGYFFEMMKYFENDIEHNNQTSSTNDQSKFENYLECSKLYI